MSKCPFCGKQEEPDIPKQFVCGTYWARFAKEFIQSGICMRFQLSQQTELLRRALEIVQEKAKLNPWPSEKGGFATGCQFCGKPYPQPFSNAEEHYDNCSWQKAQALLPELEEALEVGNE